MSPERTTRSKGNSASAVKIGGCRDPYLKPLLLIIQPPSRSVYSYQKVEQANSGNLLTKRCFLPPHNKFPFFSHDFSLSPLLLHFLPLPLTINARPTLQP
jgi:hypothetical protein